MIVKSILDTDLYKFTTSYAYMKLFPQARGTFEFFDRDLTEYPKDFVQKVYLELSNLGMLRLTNSELDYMTSNCRFVPQVYWEWLYSFRFNSGKVQVWLDNKKHLHITVTDYLYKVTLYEVPVLAIISELRNRVLGNNCDHYKSKALEALRNDYKETCDNYKAMSCAIYNSCKLVPTDGLGISNSDLEQIGAKSYAEVDDILQTNANNIFDSTGRWVQPLMEKYGEDVVVKVLSRHVTSEFKRMKAPIYISRELYE